ncbi:hypothetical protein Hanom_Chr15g01348641 [Helianthus anomalus]
MLLGIVYILAFDLSSEVFSTIELPEPRLETSEVTIIKGCLAVISSNYHFHFCIWMRRDGASWSLAYLFNTREEFVGAYSLQFTPNDESLWCASSKGAQVYNLETHVGSTLVDLSGSSRITDMRMYVESLELLDMGTSCDQ